MSRSRNWCFTINNFTDEEIIICDEIECTYIIYGDEIGDSGTPHLQGYLEFKDAKSLTSVRKLLGGRAHLETRRGSPIQASDYCKKQGNFFERGTMSNQGKRNDLEEIANLVKDEGIKGIIEKRPDAFIKYGRNIERLAEHLYVPRTIKPKVVWLWGTTGSGKTKKATSSSDNYYIWNGTKWWNGYTQQNTVILDDYSWDKSEQAFRYLLRLLDGYSIQVETKGGMVYFNSPVIYITCEFPPHDIFPKGNTLNQVLRRIDEIEHLRDEIYENELINIALDPQLEHVDELPL